MSAVLECPWAWRYFLFLFFWGKGRQICPSIFTGSCLVARASVSKLLDLGDSISSSSLAKSL